VDIADASGQPIPVRIAGRDWLVKPRTLTELGSLQAWFKREVPSPLVRAMQAVEQSRRLKTGVGDAIQTLVIEAAQRSELSWPPRVGTYHWLDAVDQVGKESHVLAFALQAEHPEIDDAAAELLVEQSKSGEVAAACFAMIYGVAPAPKSEAPATMPGTTTNPIPVSSTTGASSTGTSDGPATGLPA
jgi:hypothetical protein